MGVQSEKIRLILGLLCLSDTFFFCWAVCQYFISQEINENVWRKSLHCIPDFTSNFLGEYLPYHTHSRKNVSTTATIKSYIVVKNSWGRQVHIKKWIRLKIYHWNDLHSNNFKKKNDIIMHVIWKNGQWYWMYINW